MGGGGHITLPPCLFLFLSFFYRGCFAIFPGREGAARVLHFSFSPFFFLFLFKGFSRDVLSFFAKIRSIKSLPVSLQAGINFRKAGRAEAYSTDLGRFFLFPTYAYYFAPLLSRYLALFIVRSLTRGMLDTKIQIDAFRDSSRSPCSSHFALYCVSLYMHVIASFVFLPASWKLARCIKVAKSRFNLEDLIINEPRV